MNNEDGRLIRKELELSGYWIDDSWSDTHSDMVGDEDFFIRVMIGTATFNFGEKAVGLVHSPTYGWAVWEKATLVKLGDVDDAVVELKSELNRYMDEMA